MDRDTYEFSKKAARTAYQNAIKDAVGGGGQPLPDTEQHRHPDYSLVDHEHETEEHTHQELDDHLANHPVGYDDTQVKADIKANTEALAGKADEEHEHEYLTEMPEHNHPHTHDEYLTDLPSHGHDDYAPKHDHPYASEHHFHEDMSPLRHDHPHNHDGDYLTELPSHTHDYSSSSHGHNNYLTKGGIQDGTSADWKLRMLNASGGRNSYIEIKDYKIHLYHVANPTNGEHGASWGYIQENTASQTDFDALLARVEALEGASNSSTPDAEITLTLRHNGSRPTGSTQNAGDVGIWKLETGSTTTPPNELKAQMSDSGIGASEWREVRLVQGTRKQVWTVAGSWTTNTTVLHVSAESYEGDTLVADEEVKVEFYL